MVKLHFQGGFIMAKKEKPTCIVLERLGDLIQENKALKARLKILTNIISSDSREYRESLRSAEQEALQNLYPEMVDSGQTSNSK
jgi:hypothetical protein